jgi:predicted acyltransferase
MVSIDAYRGLVMFLMMAEVLKLRDVAKATGSAIWQTLAYHQSHVEWIGCSVHDMIQPSFSFLVGVALPFSLASRRTRGQSVGFMTLHAFWRALILIALGIFLRSVGKATTNFTFEDTLTQIGLGYGFLFLLALRPARDQWIALALILVGYWIAFFAYPLPPVAFDYNHVEVSSAWLNDHALHGLAAHWNKNSNVAWRFDTWFLNLFPRTNPFVDNSGGYATLSFIPTLGTMILGLLAGELLRSKLHGGLKFLWLLVGGAILFAAGWGLGEAGLCPIVKRIWTPSWVLFSGGLCFAALAVFYLLTDLPRLRLWAFPLVVIGANSIAAYCMAHLFEGFIKEALRTHLTAGAFAVFGKDYQSLVLGSCVLLTLFLILLWMYRRKVFVRI